MKTPAQLSRNQRRKREYKALAGQEGRAQKRARLKGQRARAVRLVGRRGPHVPCGNISCARCFAGRYGHAAAA